MTRMPWTHKQAERALHRHVLDGLLLIDVHGRIWRPGHQVSRRAEKLCRGYLMVRVMRGARRVCGLAHRLMWQDAWGDIPDGMVINHINGVKDDNRLENLEVVTPSENSKHAYRTGLHQDQYGERNPQTRFPDEVVAEIRAAYAAGGVTMMVLAAQYGCSFQHISRLVKGQRRTRQAGPLVFEDRRHVSSQRDPVSGRFVSKGGPE